MTNDFLPHQPRDDEPDHFDADALASWSDEDWEDWAEEQRWLGTTEALDSGDVPPFHNPIKDMFG